MFDESLNEIDVVGDNRMDSTPETISVETSDHGRLLAIGCGHNVSVMDITRAAPCGPTIEHGATVSCVALSNDERLVASGTEMGDVSIRSVRSPTVIDTDIALPGHIYSMTFSPDARSIVIAAADGAARMFDAVTGELLGRPMNHENDVFDAMFSLNGKLVYTIGDNNFFAVWDANNGSMVTRNLFPKRDSKARPIERRLWLSRSPDGYRVLACGKRAHAVVYNTKPYENTVSGVDTAQQRALLELASNQFVEHATLVSLTTDQWLQRWNEYCHRFGLPSIDSIDAPEIRLP